MIENHYTTDPLNMTLLSFHVEQTLTALPLSPSISYPMGGGGGGGADREKGVLVIENKVISKISLIQAKIFKRNAQMMPPIHKHILPKGKVERNSNNQNFIMLLSKYF